MLPMGGRPAEQTGGEPHSETSPERDDTYENIVKPPREKQDLQAPPSGGWHQHMAGLRHWAPHLALLMLCLLLLGSTIERTIKHLHVSRELQALNDSKEIMVTALQGALQNSEQRVKELTEGSEKIASALRETEEELRIQGTIKNKTQEELRRAEEMLGEEQTKLKQWERDICPKDWILFGSKCLRFTNEEGSWEKCDESCKRVDGKLFVVQWNDLTLKSFLSTKSGDSWVGREFRWEEKEWKGSWKWPNQYREEWGKCWQIRNGKLMLEKCSEMKKCVCEKNIILVTVKKYKDYEIPHLNLWDVSYYCWRN